jgi:hypothetical protein
MVTQWLHLEELGGDPWVLPVWAAANAAAEAGKFPRLALEVNSVGVGISIKLNIIARVVARINDEARALYTTARTHDPNHLFTKGRQGCALRVDNDLKYQLISDIEAFLFEVNSCAELMERLVAQIFSHTGRPSTDCDVRRAIRGAHVARGVNVRWFGLLDKNRNFVAHEGACYLAIDVSDDTRWELLIMRENLVDFDDPSKYFTLADLSVIAQGFVNAKGVLRELLIGAFSPHYS